MNIVLGAVCLSMLLLALDLLTAPKHSETASGNKLKDGRPAA